MSSRIRAARSYSVRVARSTHLALEASDVLVGLTGDERAEVVDDLAVLVGRDPADAGRGALADVAQQAGPADLCAALEHPGRARPHRKDAQQQVDGLPDRPGVRVRPEVAHALLLRSPAHHHARELLVDRDSEPRIGLVVAVLHVEARVVLLDPGVLQLQRLDLGLDDGPLDRASRRHHPRRALVQVREVLEVRREAGAQRLRLADVDDPTGGIAEAVDTRCVGDRPRRGSICRGIGHASTLRVPAVSLVEPSDRRGSHRASRPTVHRVVDFVTSRADTEYRAASHAIRARAARLSSVRGERFGEGRAALCSTSKTRTALRCPPPLPLRTPTTAGSARCCESRTAGSPASLRRSPTIPASLSARPAWPCSDTNTAPTSTSTRG